ncbi:MAG: hypothetical protein R2725_16225 [Solirubrobacterales bacterium]
METAEAREEAARGLVEELLRTGLALVETVGALIEEVSGDAFPGEDAGVVLIEMVVGSCRPALEAAGEADCQTATALVAAIGESVHRDLRAAATLAAPSEAA